MFCSISGSAPEEPVITKAGHLFEKRLVEKHIKEFGKCPVTGEALTADDLIPVKVNKVIKPRTAPAASIPGLLGLFQEEWDAVMLETHSLRQSLHTVRQELSHALYQHDAACRVIARLMRERDESRAALQDIRSGLAADAEASKRGAEGEAGEAKRQKKAEGIPEEVLAELLATNQTLSKGRKKRAIPESLATAEDLAGATLIGTNPLHKTTQPGITVVELSPDQENVLATAGADGTVQIFDYTAGRVLSSIDAHSKRITGLQFTAGGSLFTSSADKTARLWRSGDSGWTCAATFKDHSGTEVVSVSAHPSRKYAVTAGADGQWNFYDLVSATLLKQVSDPNREGANPVGYTCAQFHPDGLILGTGTDKSTVRIWELRELKAVATFEGHAKPLRSLCFSENGYHLATVSDDCVKLWDLRKLKNFKTLEPYEGGGCWSAAFDHSGSYLAVGGPDARVYGQKQDWSVIKAYSDLPKKGSVTALRFGPDARQLFVGAGDHNLRTFAASGAAPMQQ